MKLNEKPVGFARPSDLTMLGIGVDVSHISIRRDADDQFSVPLYTKASEWPVMGESAALSTPTSQP